MAAELLEVFQWSGFDTVCESKKEKIKSNNAKYPVEKAKDSAKKYNEL